MNEIAVGVLASLIASAIFFYYLYSMKPRIIISPVIAKGIYKDGRTVYKAVADIHHEAGMMCTDCHSSKGIMGDEKDYKHEENAIKISCEDCHYPIKKPPAVQSLLHRWLKLRLLHLLIQPVPNLPHLLWPL